MEGPVLKKEEYLVDVVEELSKQIKITREALAEIKIIQFAPCGMFEGPNINGLIESSAIQTLPQNERMLILFVNGDVDSVDTVTEYINKNKVKYPELNIIQITHRWISRGAFSMGMIRAIPVEVIKKIYLKNKLDTNPLVVSNDADCRNLPKKYLETYCNSIGENEFGGNISRFELSGKNFLYDLNLVLGVIDRSLRNFRIPNMAENHPRGKIFPPGSNTVFRLNDYPGYDLDKNKGEDSDLCKTIEKMGSKMVYVSGAKVFTDPRRVINTFNSGGFFHDTWKDWEGSGEIGRDGSNQIEEKQYSEQEVVDYLNRYFESMAIVLLGKDYHKNDFIKFVDQVNFYTKKMIKYLNIALKSGKVPIPNLSFNPLYASVGESVELMATSIKDHKFISIAADSSN